MADVDISRRAFLKTLGAAAALAVVPLRWVASHDPRTVLIAASDASASDKNRADVVCTGRDDQQKINAALHQGKRLVMTGGTFYLSGAIELSGSSNALITNCRFVSTADEAIHV